MRRLLEVAALIACGAALLPSGAVAAEPPAPLPRRLSEVGLFAPGSPLEIRPELVPFSPQYPLWSDGAEKRRWLELPPGTSVNAADIDAWEFPPGTRLFKEFALAGRPVETRLIERLGDGSWRFATYVWREDGSDADLAPAYGIRRLPRAGAPNGRYAIPSEYDCRACHEGSAGPVLGFSALQLSGDRDAFAPNAEALDLDQLRAFVERGIVRNLPPSALDAPPRIAAQTPVERAALGYLHGNCGHCHSAPSAAGSAVPVPVVLQQSAADPAASAARTLRSLVDTASRFRPPGASDDARVVAPGSAGASVLTARMRSRDPRVQMPPLATVVPDPEALALIERWINHDLQHHEDTKP